MGIEDYETGNMPFVHVPSCPFNTVRDYKKERKEELKNLKLIKEWDDPTNPEWHYLKFNDGTVRKVRK